MKKGSERSNLIVGVDEAGRGPLAGPVSLGVVAAPLEFSKKFGVIFKNLKDSKKLSAKKREEFFDLILKFQKKKKLDFCVSFSSNSLIDRKGIVFAIKNAMQNSFEKLKISENTQMFLDGGLRAEEEYKNQKTIIKGDEKIPVISIASICAKVLRDELMEKLSKKYPEYNFSKHKGYGTREHIDKIRKYGLSKIHRKSFCKRFAKKP